MLLPSNMISSQYTALSVGGYWGEGLEFSSKEEHFQALGKI